VWCDNGIPDDGLRRGSRRGHLLLAATACAVFAAVLFSTTIQTHAKLYRRYRCADVRRRAALPRAIQAGRKPAWMADVNDKPFLVIMLALVVLLALACWQFFLLVGK
jgi:hypothetical protein